MASRNRSGKGNPAAHRMGNARLKSRREASWARGERRKQARKAENEARHAANVAEYGPSRPRRATENHHGNGNPFRPSKARRRALREAARATTNARKGA